jgi:hypothetical protein
VELYIFKNWLMNVGLLFKDSDWGFSVRDINVEDSSFSDCRNLSLTDPSPESDWLGDFALLKLCFVV